MSGDIRSAFITLALSLPAIVLCLSIHETAHGGAAYLLGDRTARDSGRVTLSPMAHIDPIGFLCLLLFGFGWARPVPVNIANFRNRRWGMALTAPCRSGIQLYHRLYRVLPVFCGAHEHDEYVPVVAVAVSAHRCEHVGRSGCVQSRSGAPAGRLARR